MTVKRFFGLFVTSFVVLVVLGTGSGVAQGASSGGAKNVIIFIGDGMGTSHRDLIRYATVGPEEQLAMDAMPYAGRSETSPLDPEAFVTDSAAGGTAIATGVKTFNGAVGVDEDGNPVPSVLEAASQSGMATGLVTDSQVTDATPASFAAHVEDRGEQSEIARQYLEESKPEVILGGGEDYWCPEGDPCAFPDAPEEDPFEKSEGTEGNLIEDARNLGYEYVTDTEGLNAATGDRLLGLFANEEMFQAFPEGEGDSYEPRVSLPEMTGKAIETLSRDPDGFFLMVEGEGVDEMAHQSNTELVIESGQALDEAVQVGKDFASENPDTLIIVTADHETGGLAIEDVDELQDDPEYPNETGEGRTSQDGPFDVANSDEQFVVDWTTANHTAEDVPVTAMGPGAEGLSGVYQNTRIHDAMLSALGLSAGTVSTSATSAASGEIPDTGGITFGWGAALLLVGGLAGFGALYWRRRRAG